MSPAREPVYFDHAATTPLRPEVLDAMMPFLTSRFGNPSSLYGLGRDARKAVETAREQVAAAIGAHPSEILFTSGGTEADNWALWGPVSLVSADRSRHLITSAIEHHAILHVADRMASEGVGVTTLPVDPEGRVSVEDLRQAIRPDTILASVMLANNEIGTVQPIRQMADACRERGVLFHTDAIQAPGYLPLNVRELGVDLMSLSAHKAYGPKGVGALFVRRGVRLPPMILGGGQERRKRAGTENTAGIAGFAKAMELAVAEQPREADRLRSLKEDLVRRVQARIPHVRINGDPVGGHPGIASFCFRYIEGESLLLLLDAAGYLASSGSACTSGSLDPSHVLLAIGLPHEIAHGSLRISLGRDNGPDQLPDFVDALARVVDRLREMSPLYENSVRCGGDSLDAERM